ncbi:hypothetical protein ACFLT4_05555 [Chloroflexota bacterium]
MPKLSNLVSNRIEVPDSVDEINEFYYQHGWTDGLPVVPPTEDRVQTMLLGTTRKPQDSMGKVPPIGGEATIEKVAINAVLAGCAPEYMPVILAALEAMLDEQFNLFGLEVATHPATPLVIVNGPIRDKLLLNSGYNVFGQGTRANATIGRAISLIMVNIGGSVPGKLDRATLGAPSKYSFCIAENEERNPWQPLHVERGFDKSASTVTVLAAESPHNINDHQSIDAEGMLTTMAGTMAIQGSNNILYQVGEVLLVIGPEHASTIASSGFSKQDARHFIFEKARIPKSAFSSEHQTRRFPSFRTNARIPIVCEESDIMIIVAGGIGKHSMFCPTYGPCIAVTKQILP